MVIVKLPSRYKEINPYSQPHFLFKKEFVYAMHIFNKTTNSGCALLVRELNLLISDLLFFFNQYTNFKKWN